MISYATALLLAAPSQSSGYFSHAANLSPILCKPDASASGAPGRIILFGDSITAGWANKASHIRRAPWVNKGNGGDTAQNARWRLCRDVIREKPAIVHVMFGTNDIAGNAGNPSVGQIRDYLIQIVATLRAHHIRVVLGSVLPASDFPWRKGTAPAGKIVALNHVIKAYAASHCIRYADYWSAMATSAGGLSADLTTDGVHPNAKGYEVMEPIAEKAIAEASLACDSRHE